MYIYVCVGGGVYYNCYSNGSDCCSNISVCMCVCSQDIELRATKLHLDIYVCMCMYAFEQKANSSRVCVCLLIERMCMCVVGDIEVYEKWSRLKDGKHTNFVVTMNVFLLAVLRSLVVWSSEWVSLCLKEFEKACEYLQVSEIWECQRVREVVTFESVK